MSNFLIMETKKHRQHFEFLLLGIHFYLK